MAEGDRITVTLNDRDRRDILRAIADGFELVAAAILLSATKETDLTRGRILAAAVDVEALRVALDGPEPAIKP